jgi:hypothetical protein
LCPVKWAQLARILLIEGIMPGVYEAWVGQHVVLQVTTGELRVPLRGIIVGESEETVRFRVGDSWDVDVFKNRILAVEEDHWASIVT